MSAATLSRTLERVPEAEGGWQARAAQIESQLAGPRETIERTFLEMGQQLLGCTKLLGEMSAAHEGMPGELEGEDFTTAAATLAAIRDEVSRMISVQSGEEQYLEQLAQKARETAAYVHDLRKSVRTVRLIAVNARITAASIRGSQAELGAFTVDMEKLARDIEDAVSTFGEAYERFSTNLATARSASTAFAARHGATMSRIADRLSRHLDRIVAHRQGAAAAAAKHMKLAAQIRGRIASAVSALQVGDITRQRVEHVEEMLQMLREHQAGWETSQSGQQDMIAATCQLAATLLEDASLDFGRGIAELGASLGELAIDAGRVVEAGNEHAKSMLSDGEAALGGMIRDLGEIRAIFRDFAETRAGMEKIAGAVAQSVTLMVDHLSAVAEIEQQMRLLSLNTAIQCGRLGDDGRALRVIVQDMRDIAGETLAASSAILAGVEEAGELAHSLVSGEAAGLAHRIAALDGEVNTANDLLGAVTSRLRARVTTMLAIGPRAVNQLDGAAGHAADQAPLGQSWSSAQESILTLVPSAQAAFDPAALDHDFLARLRRRYTMDSERHVHDSLFGSPPSEPAPAAQQDSVTELDDFFL